MPSNVWTTGTRLLHYNPATLQTCINMIMEKCCLTQWTGWQTKAFWVRSPITMLSSLLFESLWGWVVLFLIQILLPSFPAPSLAAWPSANLGRLAQLDRYLSCGRLQIQTPAGPNRVCFDIINKWVRLQEVSYFSFVRVGRGHAQGESSESARDKGTSPSREI